MGSAPFRIAHAEQYAGVWAIQEKALAAMRLAAQSLDLRAHVESHRAMEDDDDGPIARRDPVPVQMTADGIAVVEVRGVMLKYGSSMTDAPPTLEVTRKIRTLMNDGVRGIVMVIDSPGGTVDGIDDLFRAVTAARRSGVATVAFCEDLCASAGYYVASAFEKIIANPSAWIGSIGVYTCFEDLSGLYEKAGVQMQVFRSTPLKGAGTPGTSLSDDQASEIQKSIDAVATRFTACIAAGRGVGIDTAQRWADARMHQSADAVSLNLIDGIGDMNDAIALCRSMRDARQGDNAMKITGSNGTVVDDASMTDAQLRAFLTEHRPGVLAAEPVPAPDEGEDEDCEAKKKKAEQEAADAKAAEDAAAGQSPAGAGSDGGGDAGDAEPKAKAAAAGPATIAELKAAGITDNGFIVGAVERGLSLSAATLAWETAQRAAPSAQRAADPVAGHRGNRAAVLAGATRAELCAMRDGDPSTKALCDRIGLSAAGFADWAMDERAAGRGSEMAANLRNWADAVRPER